LVFELYRNHAPNATDNVIGFATGNNHLEASYKGTKLDKGFPGIVLQGGRVTGCNASADGGRLADENMQLRHYKRGQLTLANDGENASGSEFMITLGTADMLDGYHQVVGELVEGEDILKQAEDSLTRLGTVEGELRIENSGTR
jgi:cyclophilin family peptidyl-prolyl cis-trans isomerase